MFGDTESCDCATPGIARRSPALLACPHLVAQVRSWCIVGLELTLFVVHVLCKFSGYDSLVGEGSGLQATQGRVGSIFVVVAPPFLDALAGIGQRQEPRGVQAFRSQAAVERLDVGVVGRLSGREKSISTPFR